MSYLVYTLVAALAAVYFSKKTERKFLSFSLIFWMFAQPVINAEYIIELPGLPFDLQPNRILLLLMLLFLLRGMFSTRKVPVGARPPFEKYLYIYLLLVMIALALNLSSLEPKRAIAVLLEIITFAVVYEVAKQNMTEKMVESILKAIVFLAVVLAVIAIMQIAVDPEFLRTGPLRPAFGSLYRSAAIFGGEYELGYFQILALIVVLIRYRKRMVLYIIAPLLVFSVILTFHRLDYLILYICYATYISFFIKIKLSVSRLVFAMLIPFMLLLAFYLHQSFGLRSGFLEERILDNTVTGRFFQYWVVLESMWSHPMGLGSYQHPIYIELMNKHNMMQWIPNEYGESSPRPLSVHNGFLAVGIKYGIPAMLVFTTFVISMLRHFKKMINPELRYSLVPFYAVMIYVLSNVSNSVSIFRAYFVVLLAIICGAFVALNRRAAANQEKIIIKSKYN